MPETRMGHRWPVRVYYEDTDCAGIVYYANYLRFAERARSEWLRSIFAGPAEIAERFGVGFAVRHAEIDFRRAARLDDALIVATGLIELRGSSLTLAQEVERDCEPVCRMQIRLACLNSAGAPARLPAALREALGAGRPELATIKV